MEDQAISDGFSNMKDGKEYDDLYTAALCRERADWIVGMNATRLFSTLYGQTLNVGRVMTPTLAMIVEREAEIEGFKPEPIYRLSIKSGAKALKADLSKQETFDEIVKIAGNRTIDVIIAGPPCQGFSLTGPRNFDDERNKLYLAVIEMVKQYRPKAFIIENVPGMAKQPVPNVIMEIPFADIFDTAARSDRVAGVVINPFGRYFKADKSVIACIYEVFEKMED